MKTKTSHRAQGVHVSNKKRNIVRDLWLLGISIVMAFVLVRVGVVDAMLTSSQELYVVSAFIAGIFFTSVLTISPASVVLAQLADHLPLLLVAGVGALGAVAGDLFLFYLIKDTLVDDVSALLSKSQKQKIHHIFSRGFFKSLTPLIGALIIASPLPDELGLALLGASKMRLIVFIPISYTMNFIGILLIGGLFKLF